MTGDRVKVGVLLGTRGIVMQAERQGQPPDFGPLLEMAERAENGGLDSVWVGDSLLSKPRLEPVAALAALAVRTERLRIGTAVLLPALRHPVALAHSLATVDVLSRGRLTVAAGVGGAFTPEQRGEWTAVGVSPESRAGRLRESVQLMRRLWREDRVSFHGKYFDLEEATLHPRPVQPGGIPLLLGCHHRTGSSAQYRRAARYADGIIGISDAPPEYARVVEHVAAAAREEGRGEEMAEKAFYMTVNINDDESTAASEALDFLLAYYGINHWGDRWGPWGSPERVAERMAAYTDAGATHLIVRFAAWDQPAQLRRLLDGVLPRVRAQAENR